MRQCPHIFRGPDKSARAAFRTIAVFDAAAAHVCMKRIVTTAWTATPNRPPQFTGRKDPGIAPTSPEGRAVVAQLANRLCQNTNVSLIVD
jgi:hypothetical protein